MSLFMYTESTRSLVTTWGEWLQETHWDYFSTITYKWNVTSKRNLSIMQQLEIFLRQKVSKFHLFWIMEQTSSGSHTHNHLLIQNPIVVSHIDFFMKERNLVDKRFVKHIPFDKKLGAGFYVSKNITSPKVEYNLIIHKTILKQY